MKELTELQAIKKFSKDNKKRAFKNIGKYLLRKNPNLMTFLSLEKQIKEQLKAGLSKKVIWLYLTEEKVIDFSYTIFCNYLKKSEEIQQTTQEDTVIEKIEASKPEETQPVEAEASQNKTQQEQETNLVPEETQTTQTVEPEKEKSEALQRVIEHRQKVQAQRATEATTGTKPEQQTGQTGEKTHAEKVEDYFSMMMSDTEVYPNLDAEFDVYMAKFYANNPREGRKFGEPPEGKALADLPQELQDTIKQEKTILREEQRTINKALNRKSNQKMREETEKNKFHHDPEAKPPGYWTGGQLTGS